jgi:hypothetical protein
LPKSAITQKSGANLKRTHDAAVAALRNRDEHPAIGVWPVIVLALSYFIAIHSTLSALQSAMH